MKKAIVLFFALGLVQLSYGQLLKIGVRAGANSTNLVSDDFRFSDLGQDIRINSAGSSWGLHGGIFARVNVPILGFYIQPEALITSAGGEYRIQDGSVSKNAEVRFTRFDFPVLFGYKFGPARVNIGPVGSINLSQRNGLNDAIADLATNSEQSFRGTTWGYQAGVGLDVWKLAIDAKFENNLSKLGDGVTLFGQQRNFDTRARQFIVSVGYWF
jgi:hypothetical protein